MTKHKASDPRFPPIWAYCSPVLLLLAVVAGVPDGARAQQVTGGAAGKVDAPLPASSYLSPTFPGTVISLLSIYGDRLSKPGNERVTLTGTYADSGGSTPATIITQIPGEIRVTIAGATTKTLLFDGNSATANGAAVQGVDSDIVESLQSDTVENFFYSYGKTAGVRFIGARFRADGKATQGYVGPYYDIYELVQPVKVRGTNTPQQKFYYFDSTTGQFVKTRYKIQRGGQIIDVQTVYSGWSKTSGQSLPGSIERRENGQLIFSFVATNGQLAAGAVDAVFSHP